VSSAIAGLRVEETGLSQCNPRACWTCLCFVLYSMSGPLVSVSQDEVTCNIGTASGVSQDKAGVSQDRAMYSLGTALSVPLDRSRIDGCSVSQDTDMRDTEWSSDLSRVAPPTVDGVAHQDISRSSSMVMDRAVAEPSRG
jgi:hypothetical protein